MEKSQQVLNVVVVMTCMMMMFGASRSSGKELVVGDEFGWAVPSSESFYHWWASHQTFEPNDVLVFNFVTGAHTVAQVSRVDYEACNASNPIRLYTSSPARVTINPDEDNFYICTVGTHCTMFQKLAI